MRLDARSKDESSQLIKNHYLPISRAENLAKLYITQITQSLINESIESKLNITKQGNKFILYIIQTVNVRTECLFVQVSRRFNR